MKPERQYRERAEDHGPRRSGSWVREYQPCQGENRETLENPENSGFITAERTAESSHSGNRSEQWKTTRCRYCGQKTSSRTNPIKRSKVPHP